MFKVVNLAIRLITGNILVMYLAIAEGGRTNINQVNDFFNQEIEGKIEIEQQIKGSKEQANDGIAGKNALQELGISEHELIDKSREMGSINPHDLSIKGQEERNKPENSYFDSLELDVTDPGLLKHKKDMDLIAKSTGDLIGTLTKGLKDLGLDCKEVAGNSQEVPEYYINIKKKMEKDTRYDQVFCEHLRNHYVCHDKLALSCKTKGIQKGRIQPKMVNLGAMDLWNLGVFNGEDYEQWGNTYEDAKLVLKIRLDATSIPVVKNWLALKEGVNNDFIDNVKVSYHGGIMFMNLDSRKHGFITYRLDYEVAEKYEICLEWSQEWNEVCELN